MNMYKVFFHFLLLNFLIISVHAQNRGARELDTYDQVIALGNIEVYLEAGSSSMARIEAENIDLDKVVTKLTGTRLEVRLKNGIHKDAEVRVYLSYDHLREIRASAAARIYTNGAISGDKLEMYAGSGGRIEAEVAVNALEQRVMEGSRIRVWGSAPNHECRVYSGGVLEAEELESDFTFARVNTGGAATITVKDKLEASVGTGGRLTYYGSPGTETIKTHLGANVVKAE